MGVEIKPAVREVEALPKKQVIIINGVECGECEPSLYADELRWHAVVRLRGNHILGSYLVQGHGASPQKAIADGILRARRELRAVQEQMTSLENEFGTAAFDDYHVARSFGLTN